MLIGTDSLLNNQEMNTELPTMHETPELQVFRLFIGRLPTTQVKGYGAYPVGGVQGGKGTFKWKFLRDRTNCKNQDDTQ